MNPIRIAHHARGFNERSIGIELVNRGRFPEWLHSRRQQMDEPYTQQQIDRLAELIRWLCSTMDRLQKIAGHEDLDMEYVPAADDASLRVRRKLDPGPLFPWNQLIPKVPLCRYFPGG